MEMVKEALSVTVKKAKCFNINSEGGPGEKKKWEGNNFKVSRAQYFEDHRIL